MALDVGDVSFDYEETAELFPGRNKTYNRGSSGSGYKRFARASDAIRFAIEELPRELLVGAYLQVDEMRFDSAGIRGLYDRPDYPHARRPPVAANKTASNNTASNNPVRAARKRQ